MKPHAILEVIPGSIADELGIVPGDALVSIDSEPIADLIDYQALIAKARIELRIETQDGELVAEVEKDEDEGLGLIFDSPLMSAERECANNCVFCFVDQMPKGMRESLYFKDDDWRMSLMTGNFITLTNVNDKEFQRIVERRVSPLYISVQTTDPGLRRRMLGVEREVPIMERLRALKDAGLEFHAQIVAVCGLNDGEALERTLSDLSGLYPSLLSAAIVPVGLTKHREGLSELKPYEQADAADLIAQVGVWQKKAQMEHSTSLFYLADEFYLKAGQELPPPSHYEEFEQLENGVGMASLFIDEFKLALEGEDLSSARNGLTLVTGVSAAPIIEALTKDFDVEVVTIVNEFFGETVTVAGLVTGADIIAQLGENRLFEKKPGGTLLIPDCMLKHGEDVFLDDVRVCEVEAALNTKIEIVRADGESLCYALLGVRYE